MRLRGFGSGPLVATISGTMLITLAACSTADKPTYNVREEAQKKLEQNPELQGWSDAARQTIMEKLGWDKLPDGPPSSTLPPELAGTVFLGEDGTEVNCLPSSKATILSPGDPEPIQATYTVGQPGNPEALDLKYMDNGKECHVVYAAQCLGRKATLNQQWATLPRLPSYLRGTLPE
ncbi:MAG TPA: hypothetical protein V6D08_08320 [Candidatus Obscuribacterales bacterium]